MQRKKLWIIGGATAAVVLATGAGVATAISGDDDAHDTPITGSALKRATAVALAETGGGRVTGSEAGDEEGAYEVEVTLDSGKQVDVHLDSSFKVISSDRDHGDGAGADD
jgi:hypothetical protein